MALTLPVEEMSRLQVSFKLSLPDGCLTFEMAPVTTPSGSQHTSSPPGLSGLKLHFHGVKDESGLSLKVWATGSLGAQPSSTPSAAATVTEAVDCLTAGNSTRTRTENVCKAPLTNNVEANKRQEQPVSLTSNPTLGDLNRIALPTSEPLLEWASEEDRPDAQMGDAFDYLDNFSFQQKWPNFHEGLSLPNVDSHVSSSQHQLLPAPSCLETRSLDPTSFHHSALTSPYAQSQNQYEDLPYLPPHSPATSSSSNPTSTSAFVSSIDCDVPPSSDATTALTEMSATASTRSCSPELDSQRPYQCLEPDCSRWFKRDYTRKVHMLTHRRTKERKPFGCNIPGCPERFSRKHDRLRHEVGRHGVVSEWRCEPCNRFFSSKATLERHRLDKHGDETQGL